MVQVEGIGKQQPSPSVLMLTAGDLQQLIREAKRRAAHRGYGSRSDSWGQGMTGELVIANVGSIDGPAAPIFIGLCGEYAVSVLANRHCGLKSSIDMMLLPGGDGGTDLEFLGLKAQVKTRRKDYGTYLVRHSSQSGAKDDHRADAFVFATWVGRGVSVDGCIKREDVLSSPVESAPAGRGHKNYVVNPADLLPMARLYAAIRSRELWR